MQPRKAGNLVPVAVPNDTAESGGSNPQSSVRQPAQQRSRRRVKKVLDAVEQLLNEHEPEELNYTMIAAASGVGRSSVYQFFPNLGDIFDAVNRRYSVIHGAVLHANYVERDPQNVEDAIDCIVDSAVFVFNANLSARRTALVSRGKTRMYWDRDYNRWYSRKMRDLLGSLAPPKVREGDPLEVAAIMMISIYALAVLRDGVISPYYVRQAKRAVGLIIAHDEGNLNG